MTEPTRKSKTKVEFATSKEMQAKYLALMIQDQAFRKEVSGYLQAELFDSTIHRGLFEILKDFSKTSPDSEVTEALMLEGIARRCPEEERSFAVKTYKELSSDPLTDRELVKSCIRPFVVARKMEDALRLSVDLYEKGKFSEIRLLIDDAEEYGRSVTASPIERKSTKGLKMKKFEDPKWLIPTILPEGVSLLAGRPKMGKSYLVLESLIAMSCGGFAFGSKDLQCPKRGVLYISLEDGEKRLQSRIQELAGDAGFNENFYFETEWPKLDKGGLQKLEKWLDDAPEVDVVAIDTWQRIKGETSSKGNAYENDVNLMTPLKAMADKRGISIVLIHHTRKASADDPLDEVSGSTGLTGSVDTILIIRRDKGGNPSLYVRGRDVEQEEYALERSETGGWTLEGKLEDRLTPEQQQVIDVLAEYKTLRLVEIAARIGKSKQAVLSLVSKLIRKGLVISSPYGGYELKKAHPHLAIVK